jgi:hypothetical protein
MLRPFMLQHIPGFSWESIFEAFGLLVVRMHAEGCIEQVDFLVVPSKCDGLV